MIKYHEYGKEYDYGEDRSLTNNWNPNIDYGNEYAKVYFQMDSKGYGYPSFCFTEEQRGKFDDDIKRIFSSVGWECKKPAHNGLCSTWVKGKSHLYLHPQTFSGEVLKNNIKEIAQVLQMGDVISLRWVDIRDTVYELSDGEYLQHLRGKSEEIQTDLYDNFGTTRVTKFYYTDEVVCSLLKKYGLLRIGISNDKVGKEYIENVIKNMSEKELIKLERGSEFIRSLNKMEKKKKPFLLCT